MSITEHCSVLVNAMRQETNKKKYNNLGSRRQNYIICRQYDCISFKRKKQSRENESPEKLLKLNRKFSQSAFL